MVAVTPTTLDLSWLRPQAELDRFVVSYVSAGNQRVRLEVPPEADRTQLTDLMPGVEYVVTVTAERGHAVSYPASIRANTGTVVLLGKSLVSETGGPFLGHPGWRVRDGCGDPRTPALLCSEGTRETALRCLEFYRKLPVRLDCGRVRPLGGKQYTKILRSTQGTAALILI